MTAVSARGRTRGGAVALALVLALGACRGGADDLPAANDDPTVRVDDGAADDGTAGGAAPAETEGSGPGSAQEGGSDGGPVTGGEAAATDPDRGDATGGPARPRPTGPPTFRDGGVLEEAFGPDNPFPDTDLDCVTDEDLEVVEQVLGPDAVEEFEELVAQGYLERC